MVHVRALVRVASVAVALCAATASARVGENARDLQLSLFTTVAATDPVSPTPPAADPSLPTPDVTTATPPPVTVLPPSPTSPAPDSPSPVTPEPVTPSVTTPQPTTATPEPTTKTPEPTTTAPPTPEPTTTAPLPPATTTPAPLPPATTTPAPPPPATTTPAPEPPATTTPAPEPPATTTPAPVPVTTTPAPEPPATTTPAPEPPATTTPAPVPGTTTPAPEPPATTTPAPVPGTTTPAPEPPATTTPAPEPGTTTPAPVPGTTTPAPEPGTTTPAPVPGTTTPAPEPGTTTPAPVPGTTTPAPEPGTTTPAPVPGTTTPAPEPGTTTPAPVPGTTTPAPEPGTTTPAPDGPTTKPPTSAPPLIVVDIPTELPDTPAPSSSKKSDPTPQPDVNSQANKKDIITFNSTDETDAPKANPFEIKVIEKDTQQPVVLNIGDDGSKTDAPKLYVRGDTKKTESPSAVDNSSGSSKNDKPGSAPNVIGGSRRNTATSADSILSKSSQNFHDFLRYAGAAFSGISVALLLFFHFVSLDATLTWTTALWSPNTWEFILYVGYLQQMASVSQLTLLKTPYYLWDYADSFAWTNFLIQRSTSSDGRRLETIVLGGVVAYADRIGIDESKIVYHAVVGFAVVLAALLVLFLIIAVFAKRKAEQALDDPMNLHHSTQSVHALRSASIRTLGLCVLIWYFALYPLSLYASFEMSMEVQAKSAVASALIVSILAIGVMCFGVLAWSGRVIMQKSKEELLQFENMATWGSLYAEFSFRSRMFFVLGALVQIVTGIIVGTMDSDPTQLIIVIIIEVLYLVAVFVLSPFAELLVLRFTYALGLLKILNFSLAFAFLNSNGMSGAGRNHVANAFIGINTIVIIVWFIRQLIVFSTYIRAWSVRTSFIEETANANEDSTVKFETRTATDSDVYASVSTARHGDGGPGVDTDDYHKAPAPREIHY